jgi:hypothetical protein
MNDKYLDKRSYKELCWQGRPDTSITQVFIDKRSRPNISKLEEACKLMAKGGVGLKAAAHRFDIALAVLERYRNAEYKHYISDDDLGSASEDDGAYMNAGKNQANLVGSESEEDSDDE